MKFKRVELINFYESPKSWDGTIVGRGSHVAAITGLIGEDLIMALVRHYWSNIEKEESKIISYQCNQGTKAGKRLDAWIEKGNKCIYQVEIKNWSAHSLGGYDHPPIGSEQTLKDFATKRWNHYFGDATKLAPEIAKVAIDMTTTSKLERKKLICFWAHIVNTDGNPYSKVNAVEVFSASAYLRSLKDDSIELELPRAELRLALLNNLLEKPNLGLV